jgi:hypothetical protein
MAGSALNLMRFEEILVDFSSVQRTGLVAYEHLLLF